MAATTAISGALIGGVVMNLSAAVASDRDIAAQAKAAAKQARLAEKALDRDRTDEAIGRAEQAVLLAPDDAAHRALLGRAYLAAGRFNSAAQVFEGVLSLDPADGRTALNLSLARIALGDWQGARRLLDDNASSIQPADRGLAIALAGDPMAAIEVLGAAAREPTANAKVRQNLALALALGGKWSEAHMVASVDLSPADARKRIIEWAHFARPVRATDQVAALLGVTPVEDGGMPVQLALRPSTPAVAVAAVPAPMAAYVAVAAAQTPPPVEAPAVPDVAQAAEPRIVFAARQEIVQSIPQRVNRAAPVRTARADPARSTPNPSEPRPAPRALAGGQYYVQLGAFENAGVARDAWSRLSARVSALAGQTPRGMSATVDGGQYYRLSVGGYARGDANALCRTVRARGGRCFVRAGAGEAVASWARGAQLASR
ncbi:SPOR domain-containing protein [Sphingomonas sp.]|uniref:SPOR domain-containing protein n=1 Tax=Sphingomonas sp. TaxID=28214 RepID=UPI002D810D99|nr:SPOR domain-containing protein [Sphingomonas sp.]